MSVAPRADDHIGLPLRETERQTVVRVLGECGGSVSQAARTLGVSRGLI